MVTFSWETWPCALSLSAVLTENSPETSSREQSGYQDNTCECSLWSIAGAVLFPGLRLAEMSSLIWQSAAQGETETQERQASKTQTVLGKLPICVE